jgi:hypothetical protein
MLQTVLFITPDSAAIQEEGAPVTALLYLSVYFLRDLDGGNYGSAYRAKL